MQKEEKSKKDAAGKINEVRRTYIVNEDYANKINSIAYWDRVNIKNIINSALANYIDQYEKKNGLVKQAP